MARSAHLRDLAFLLLVWKLSCASVGAQFPVSSPGPAPAAAAKPNLRIDVVDPDRSRKEKGGQGMTGELPLDTTAAQAPVHTSAQGGADAVALARASDSRTVRIRNGSTISFRLADPLSSGTQHNGDIVRGTLAVPVTTTEGKTLPQGATVTATVVSSARAGTIASGGVLSIELTHVDGVPVVSDIRIFDGKPGHRDVADSSPSKGSEAEVPARTLLKFQVMN